MTATRKPVLAFPTLLVPVFAIATLVSAGSASSAHLHHALSFYLLYTGWASLSLLARLAIVLSRSFSLHIHNTSQLYLHLHHTMVEDKYIGLALAVSSSLAIGTSFILTKKASESAYASASDNYAYFKNPLWWAGMSTLIVGEVANFAAYTFAPPILVTPLGALSVIIGAILASFLLDEELGHLGRIGCSLCLLGSLIIVLHAPPDKDVQTVDEILDYATRPGFLLYCFFVLVFTLVMIYGVVPRYGRTNPAVYISICSLVGSVSVMAIKGFGVAVKLTLAGHNQFTLPSTYVFGVTVVVCILVQMNYFNKALDTFSTNVVNPMYYVGFSTATIVASVILFQGFNTDDPANSISLLAGLTPPRCPPPPRTLRTTPRLRPG
ncbi:hypothetical protein BN946_scf184845.g29 [Trametes cinnabarina]|uniref:Uncharacterized protein n=1 Tax=Pycnoporus cinnabarinus TaxID=5643 RepID=A0A060SFX7_PYCCI|nr:hypothetical protein BN946_scf184845.g29 [Trametes cinnabarina]